MVRQKMFAILKLHLAKTLLYRDRKLQPRPNHKKESNKEVCWGEDDILNISFAFSMESKSPFEMTSVECFSSHTHEIVGLWKLMTS